MLSVKSLALLSAPWYEEEHIPSEDNTGKKRWRNGWRELSDVLRAPVAKKAALQKFCEQQKMLRIYSTRYMMGEILHRSCRAGMLTNYH